MIVMAIIGIVGIGMYMLLINMTTGWALSQAKMSLQQSAASITHWLERDFRNARRSTFNNRLDNLSFEIDADGDRVPDDWGAWVGGAQVLPGRFPNDSVAYIIDQAGISHSGDDYVSISSQNNGELHEWRSAIVEFNPGISAVTFGGWSRFVGRSQPLIGGGRWTIGATINVGQPTEGEFFANRLTYPEFRSPKPDFQPDAFNNPWADNWQHLERTVTANQVGADITSIQVWARYSDVDSATRTVWFDDLYVRPWVANGATPNTTVGIPSASILLPLRLQDTIDGREVRIFSNGTALFRVDADGATAEIGNYLINQTNNPTFTLVSFWDQPVAGDVDLGIDQVWADVGYERPWMNNSLTWRSRSYLMPRVE